MTRTEGAAHAREVRLNRLAARRAAASSSPTTATAEAEVVEIRPQPGPQERALACGADILVYGGAAGGGKTWALLLEAARYYQTRDFGAVIFRRTYPNITNVGGMWDESKKLYPLLGGDPDNGDLRWTFRSGACVKFSHLQHDDDKLNWKGAQIPLVCFDQLEEFLEGQFWYLVSRNRSLCGVAPYVRATVNPVPADDPVGGWVHRLIQWWLDETTGLPIPGRDGVVRWFIRLGEALVWYDTRGAAVQGAREAGLPAEKAALLPKSLTFIAARLEDNHKLMTADPGYYANLMALPRVERERLYGGNWNARPTAGQVFDRAWFPLVEALPAGLRYVRYWDKAGTTTEENPAAAYSAGVKIGVDDRGGFFYVAHVVRGRWSAHQREAVIRATAQLDGPDCAQWVEQEPGSGGKESAQNTVRNLAGFTVHVDRVTGDKYTRAQPFSAQAEAGNVRVLLDAWTPAYLDELHAFDPEAGGFKDQVDASSGAFNRLCNSFGPLEFRSAGATPPAEQTTDEQGHTAFERQVLREGMYWPGGGR